MFVLFELFQMQPLMCVLWMDKGKLLVKVLKPWKKLCFASAFFPTRLCELSFVHYNVFYPEDGCFPKWKTKELYGEKLYQLQTVQKDFTLYRLDTAVYK